MSNPSKKSIFLFLLTASFVEGGAVMACELLGAKLIAPYFGTSLYVWAAVLAVTLGGLAIGYYTGGVISRKAPTVKNLGLLLGGAGVLTMLMPFIADFVLSACSANASIGIRSGSTISLLVYLLPPLVLFGSTSPLIIQLINPFADNPGRSAGTVYSISTVGGIISTLLIGFYLLPILGIRMMAITYGGLMTCIGVIAILRSKKWVESGIIMLLACIAFVPQKAVSESTYKVLMHETGILGEIKVLEHEMKYNDSTDKVIRALLINNVAQTLIVPQDPNFFLYDYPPALRPLTADLKPGQNVALLGLGGGIIANMFAKANFNTTAVELDTRIIRAARDYFDLDERVTIVEDDARHFIRTSDQKWDLLVVDLFLSESPPSHVLTLEAFRECKNILTDQGSIVINFYGIYSGEAGKGARSVLRTLERAGYTCDATTTIPGKETKANMLIRASPKKPLVQLAASLAEHKIDDKMRAMGDAVILTDDKPVLEHFYVEAAMLFKEGWNSFYTEKLIQEGYPVFN